MNNIVCTVCHQENNGPETTLFEIVRNDNERYVITKCENCGLAYTYYAHEISLNQLYDHNDYTVKDTRNSIFFKIQKFEYDFVIDKIKSISNKSSPKILDFGSGKGLFLHFANLKGCFVKGIESSVPRANYAKDYFGLNINTDYFSAGQVFETKFDVLTLFHVLEHLQNPAELLKNLIRSNLHEGGLLVTEVPNFGSWQSKWSGNDWLHLDVPRHLNHFTDETLEDLITKSDSKIIKKSYFSLHLGIIGMVQCILSWFGYKGFLIADLKQKSKELLLAKVLLALPFAIVLEIIASIFKRGGVIRYYSIYNESRHDHI